MYGDLEKSRNEFSQAPQSHKVVLQRLPLRCSKAKDGWDGSAGQLTILSGQSRVNELFIISHFFKEGVFNVFLTSWNSCCDDARVPSTDSLLPNIYKATVFEGHHNLKVISCENERWASNWENLELMQEEVGEVWGVPRFQCGSSFVNKPPPNNDPQCCTSTISWCKAD